MIYLASPYSHPDPAVMHQRFLEAEKFTAKHLALGYYIYSPIVHCHNIALHYDLPKDFAFWQRYNFDMLIRADELWILTLDGWRESRGVTAEINAWSYINRTKKACVSYVKNN